VTQIGTATRFSYCYQAVAAAQSGVVRSQSLLGVVDSDGALVGEAALRPRVAERDPDADDPRSGQRLQTRRFGDLRSLVGQQGSPHRPREYLIDTGSGAEVHLGGAAVEPAMP
jgi:hypothetical protein